MSNSQNCALILTQCIVRPICTPFVQYSSNENTDYQVPGKMETDELDQPSMQKGVYRKSESKNRQSTEKGIAQIFTKDAINSLIGNQLPPEPMAWQAGGRSTYSKYYRARGAVCWYVCRLIQHVCLPHLCENCRLIILHAGRLAFENYGDLRHGI